MHSHNSLPSVTGYKFTIFTLIKKLRLLRRSKYDFFPPAPKLIFNFEKLIYFYFQFAKIIIFFLSFSHVVNLSVQSESTCGKKKCKKRKWSEYSYISKREVLCHRGICIWMEVLKGLELHGAKAQVYKWRQETFSENSCNWGVEYKGEDTLHYCQCRKSSVAAAPQSSHAESHTLLCKSHTHLQHSDAPSVDTKYKILSSVWQWNVSQNFTSELQFWPNTMHADTATGTLWLQLMWKSVVLSFSSARKHSEPKRTLLPPAEPRVLSVLITDH